MPGNRSIRVTQMNLVIHVSLNRQTLRFLKHGWKRVADPFKLLLFRCQRRALHGRKTSAVQFTLNNTEPKLGKGIGLHSTASMGPRVLAGATGVDTMLTESHIMLVQQRSGAFRTGERG